MIEKIDVYTPISTDEIYRLWGEIEAKWEENLKPFDVGLPAQNTAKMYQLVYLYKYIHKQISKEVIAQFVKENIPTASSDQQVRHLATQEGYNVLIKGDKTDAGDIVKSGYYMLCNLSTPKPSWMALWQKRKAQLNISSFEDIKKMFNYRCASCGAKEGEPHRVTRKTVRLQQGHINPQKELSVQNCIPQCEYCNQNVYKDYFVFTPDGFPDKINNPQFLLRSDDKVKEAMMRLLWEDKTKRVN